MNQVRKPDIQSIYELSPMQEGMLVESLMRPNVGVYITQPVFMLRGLVDISALEAAWKDVIDHFPIFRTAFSYENRKQSYQIVFKSVDFSMDYRDWREVEAGTQEVHFDNLLKEEKSRGFDFNRVPLMSVVLVQLADEDYRLIWTHHHILLDGWSLPHVIDALIKSYTARIQGRLPQLGLAEPYESYIKWLKVQDLNKAEAFWREYLKGVESKLPLPLTRSTQAADVGPATHYNERHFTLSTELSGCLRECGRRERVTLNILIQMAWSVLLSRYTGNHDIIFGAVTSGRPPELRGAETIVGLLINTIPVRVKLDESLTLQALLNRLHDENVKLREFEFTALTDIHRWSDVPAGGGLFDTIVAFENYPLDGTQAQTSALPIVEVQGGECPHNPLLLACIPGKELQFHFFYDEYYYDAATMERIFGHLQQVLTILAGDLSQTLSTIDVLSAEEQQLLSREWSLNPQVLPEGQCLHTYFEQRVKAAPNSIALISKGEQLTYGELNARSNRLAWRLRCDHGISPNKVIAIHLERSVEMIVGILACLKAGGAYLPLEPDLPMDRAQHILADSGAKVMLSMRHRPPDFVFTGTTVYLDEEESYSTRAEDPPLLNGADDLAYVLYTSGSTGTPKGVKVGHSGVVNILHSLQSLYPVEKDDTYLLKTSFTFDVSVTELFGWFFGEGRLAILNSGDEGDPRALLDAIETYQVTHINFVPSMLNALLGDIPQAMESSLSVLKYLMVAGEAFTPELVKQIKARGYTGQLINLYGPTEASIYSSYLPLELEQHYRVVPIGKAVANCSAYVLDDAYRLAPVGVVGELCIGGKGVAWGYEHMSALTAEKFVPDPFSEQAGSRLYRTGDLVRWREDATLEFIGRKDFQVKVRGNRIELGEIEVVLNAHEAVRESVVVCDEHELQKSLVAYYIPQGLEVLTAQTLRGYLQGKLPAYMVPSFFMPLTKFPLTVSGKLDRKALPVPYADVVEHFEAPVTVAEQALAAIWGEVLQTEKVGIHDNFFELGGDSILNIRITSLAAKAGYPFKVKDVFAHSTISELIKHCGQATTYEVSASQEAVTGVQDLLPVQQWFFEQCPTNSNHWSQSVLLESPPDLTEDVLKQLLRHLVQSHDGLRLCFLKEEGDWKARYADSNCANFAVDIHDLSHLTDTTKDEALQNLGYETKCKLELETGSLIGAALFKLAHDQPTRLLLVVHHLVTDTMSWRILIEDLEHLYQQYQQGEQLQLPEKTTTYRYWGEKLRDYAMHHEQEELAYWTRPALQEPPAFPLDYPNGENTVASERRIEIHLDEIQTRDLLERVHEAYRTRTTDLLLCALHLAAHAVNGTTELLVHIEGDGREVFFDDMELGHTIGKFTTVYPVLLNGEGDVLGDDLKAVKEQLREVPNSGIGYGTLKYLTHSDTREAFQSTPAQILFAYYGEQWIDRPPQGQGRAFHPVGTVNFDIEGSEKRAHMLDVVSYIVDGCLSVTFKYSCNCHREERIVSLVSAYQEALIKLISHCLEPDVGGLTPSDIVIEKLDEKSLDSMLAEVGLSQIPRQVEAVYPVSPLQAGILFESLRNPNSGIYIVQPVFVMHGVVYVDALQSAWCDVIAHFPILRTAFSYQDRKQLLQVVMKSLDFSMVHEDWSSLQREVQEDRFTHLLQDKRMIGFDFNCAPLVSVTLVRFSEQEYRLVWTHHHILLDGWSEQLVLQELSKAYEARSNGRRPSLSFTEPYQYYIQWLHAQDLNKAELFWRQYLHGFENKLPLPLERDDRIGLVPGKRKEQIELLLPVSLTARLKECARGARVTLNVLMQAAWGLLLQRYTGCRDIVFGIVTSGRSSELNGVEMMVGLLINTLPMRIRLNPAHTVLELLLQLQEENLQLRTHEYAALSDVQSWSDIAPPETLFDIIYVFENYPNGNGFTDIASLPVKEVCEEGAQHNPLTLVVVPAKAIQLSFFYDAYYYDRSTLERMHSDLTRILEAIVIDPTRGLSSIDELGDEERKQVTELLNANKTSYPLMSIAARFEEIAEQNHSSIAVSFGEQRMTYTELNQRANQLAHYLREQGVAQGDVVGFMLERSLEMVIATLAIVKAGAAYLPLDPEYPAERLSHLFSESKTVLVLVQGASSDMLVPEGVPVIDLAFASAWSRESFNPAVSLATDAAAYIMYTSGSTGRPNGVVATHQGVLRLVSKNNYLPITRKDVFLQLAPTAFDAATLEIWGPLLNGAQLVIAPPGTVTVHALKELITTYGVTSLWLTAAFFHLLVREDVYVLQGLRYLLAGGDVLNPEAVRTVLDRVTGLTLVNGYGPTENTTFSCCHPMHTLDDTGDRRIPIGRPISNTTVYIVDDALNPVGPGVVGELVVGGDGLAQGYYQQSRLTAERFIPNPFEQKPGARLYRTGDLVKLNQDGVIEFIGRRDHQVKIRGYRIEPGEVESALLQVPGVAECVVLVREDEPGEKRLVAYVVGEPGSELDTLALRDELKATLPDYMVPSGFAVLAQLPLTPNGKLDRKALPALQLERAYEAPLTDAERMLAGIWAEILSHEQIGRHDNFFELGGNSLSLLRVAHRLSSIFKLEVNLSALFDVATIAEQGRYLDILRLTTGGLQEATHVTESEEEFLI